MVKDIAKSIRARLLNISKKKDENFNTLLVQYALQRLLYRLSVSQYADQFLLKGSWLFVVWDNTLHRPTKDIDLLGVGESDKGELLEIFKKIADLEPDSPDGLCFDLDAFKAVDIKKDDNYQGVRISGLVTLDSAKIQLQVDIGFGDAVTPDAVVASLPSLLDLPDPLLKVYPVYTVLAEKFHAMVFLGLTNSRIKDFFDIHVIATNRSINSGDLQAAIAATFSRRETQITNESLLVFSAEFKQDKSKARQWQSFLSKNNLNNQLSFEQLVDKIQQFIEPIYLQIGGDSDNDKNWNPTTWSWV
ncbi:MAG: nucleotidyl transferase AbiEii/AbiGii toxin family protein [Alcanivoracaceae bacterium]|nr:nucleotidyl transferase AbiEii/AbiGii toxin family protein [Alcanivoracaceae bacterium]